MGEMSNGECRVSNEISSGQSQFSRAVFRVSVQVFQQFQPESGFVRLFLDRRNLAVKSAFDLARQAER
jgi:hypothetical protein